MSANEIKTATINEYRWLRRLAIEREDWFMAEYYDSLIYELNEN